MIFGFDSAWSNKDLGAICALQFDRAGSDSFDSPVRVHFSCALNAVTTPSTAVRASPSPWTNRRIGGRGGEYKLSTKTDERRFAAVSHNAVALARVPALGRGWLRVRMKRLRALPQHC